MSTIFGLFRRQGRPQNCSGSEKRTPTLGQEGAVEILEAIEYALEMGQEPGSILADGSIIRESMREYFKSG